MISLCMPAYKCESTIKRAIDSILSQDYEDWELIVCVNGEWGGKKYLKKILDKHVKKDKRIRYVEINEANACTARNKAAELSSGEYISFFSSDFIMFPGTLRRWVEQLSNTDADFIYSGYKLLKDGKPVEMQVGAIPFDAWQLEVGNYIDGGFPMKRHVWEKGKWDPKIISLNDWDFWLTAVKKNGFKGLMVQDYGYAAEMPKEGGLSFDSHRNWKERVSTIKKKFGIKEKDICVVSLGAQPHAKRIAKLLDADFQVAPQQKPHDYKAVYLIGFYIGNGESAIHHSRVFEGCKGKKIVHWIGTDILQLIGAGYRVCYTQMKQIIDAIENCVNISEFEQTNGELRSMGINSKIIPLPIEQNIPLMPLPKKFTVATYIPGTATAKMIYNLDLIKDIIKSCPDIKFLVFGGGECEGDNVENVGWTEMNKVLEKSSCLLRFTYHDGLPVTPIEFRLAGRDAITSVQMQYMHYAGSGIVNDQNYAKKKEDVIKTIREVRVTQKKEGVRDLKKAREYYLELTDPKKFKKAIYDIIKEK